MHTLQKELLKLKNYSSMQGHLDAFAGSYRHIVTFAIFSFCSLCSPGGVGYGKLKHGRVLTEKKVSLLTWQLQRRTVPSLLPLSNKVLSRVKSRAVTGPVWPRSSVTERSHMSDSSS